MADLNHLNSFWDSWANHTPSNQNPLYLVERDLVVAPVIEARGPGALVVRHLLRHFELPAIAQNSVMPIAPKASAAHPRPFSLSELVPWSWSCEIRKGTARESRSFPSASTPRRKDQCPQVSSSL